jgi:hypothetical protein
LSSVGKLRGIWSTCFVRKSLNGVRMYVCMVCLILHRFRSQCHSTHCARGALAQPGVVQVCMCVCARACLGGGGSIAGANMAAAVSHAYLPHYFVIMNVFDIRHG